MDYSKLAAHYARLSDEEFSQIDREDLAEQAKPYYDKEKSRRIPAWLYTEPTPEMKAIALAATRKKRLRHGAINSILPMIFLGPLWGFRSLTLSGYGGEHFILWLRRFHRRTQGGIGIRFPNMLHHACKGIGVPITVQDSTFQFSLAWAVFRFFPFGFAIITLSLGTVAFICVVLLIETDSVLAKTCVVAVGAICVGYLCYKVVGRMGFTRLRASDARQKTLDLIRKIRRGTGSYDGVVVLKCEDDFWREIVALAVEKADAVIIDVSEMSENLVWELKTAFERLPSQSILLTCVGDKTSTELPSDVSRELQTAIGGPALRDLSKFFYPKNPGFFPETEGLVSALIQCISYAPATRLD